MLSFSCLDENDFYSNATIFVVEVVFLATGWWWCMRPVPVY